MTARAEGDKMGGQGPFLGLGVRRLPPDMGELVAIDTPPDGNCLFHAVLNALSREYRAAATNEERQAIAVAFRCDLADFLLVRGEGGLSVYETLAKGELPVYAATMASAAASAEDAQEAGQYTLDGMIWQLRDSGHGVGQQYIELISRFVGRSLYVLYLDPRGRLAPFVTQDIGEDFAAPAGNSVVLYHTPTTAADEIADPTAVGHYELVGRFPPAPASDPAASAVSKGACQTDFGPQDPLVAAICGCLAQMARRAKPLPSPHTAERLDAPDSLPDARPADKTRGNAGPVAGRGGGEEPSGLIPEVSITPLPTPPPSPPIGSSFAPTPPAPALCALGPGSQAPAALAPQGGARGSGHRPAQANAGFAPQTPQSGSRGDPPRGPETEAEMGAKADLGPAHFGAAGENAVGLQVFMDGNELLEGDIVVLRQLRPKVELAWEGSAVSLDAVAIYREGAVVFLALNARSADLGQSDRLLPLPAVLGEGAYVVAVYDQESLGKLRVTPETSLGAVFDVLDTLPCLGSVGFHVVRPRPRSRQPGRRISQQFFPASPAANNGRDGGEPPFSAYYAPARGQNRWLPYT